MTRFAQPAGMRGSLKWIQRAVNGAPHVLDADILQATGASRVDWLSPLAADEFAEYRDASFLERLDLKPLTPALAAFWPSRGPQWDALARTDRGDVLLIEAKAHVAEMLTPASQAGAESLPLIERSCAECAAALSAKPRAPWTTTFYQLANRIAHLWLLRREGAPAWLVLVNFLDDVDMDGPKSPREWDAAYAVAWHVLGLPARHALAKYIIHVHPSVTELHDA